MKLQHRKALLVQLGNYINSTEKEWKSIKEKAFFENSWFTPEFIDLAVQNIAREFLLPEKINELSKKYAIPEENAAPKKIGIVMAGNIPLVGFHDMFCVFLSGNISVIKMSSKDTTLIKHIVEKMAVWNAEVNELIIFASMLKDCDAYIATGSNNSSRYFEYYFQKYPTIIRKNRTSVAILEGGETKEELEALADDVYLYFGLGCRNITKIYVPEKYDFIPMLEAFKKYDYLATHNKYKNNYDYNLAILILNKEVYMSNDSILLVENASPFSRIGQLNYEYYTNADELRLKLLIDERIQCVVGKHGIPFGGAQCPGINDYADGIDTMEFLLNLKAG